MTKTPVEKAREFLKGKGKDSPFNNYGATIAHIRALIEYAESLERKVEILEERLRIVVAENAGEVEHD